METQDQDESADASIGNVRSLPLPFPLQALPSADLSVAYIPPIQLPRICTMNQEMRIAYIDACIARGTALKLHSTYLNEQMGNLNELDLVEQLAVCDDMIQAATAMRDVCIAVLEGLSGYGGEDDVSGELPDGHENLVWAMTLRKQASNDMASAYRAEDIPKQTKIVLLG